MLPVPSPKSHCQEPGFPAEMSLNWTGCPAIGNAGLHTKEALRTVDLLDERLVKNDPNLACPIA